MLRIIKCKWMITLVPIGGLANRMRTIDSAIALAMEVDVGLRIIWYKTHGLNCRFDELFQPIPDANVILKEASVIDWLINDNPRKKNFYLPRPFQWMRFDDCIYVDEADECVNKGFDFRKWARQNSVYLTSCVDFFHSDIKKKYSSFMPISCLQEQINRKTASFNEHTIGIHIRRTDNITSIRESPTQLFIDQIKKEIDDCPEANFYLASDSQEDKKVLLSVFGSRITTSDKVADRNSISGMQDALVEMYTLAQTTKIFGSAWSSYSTTAAQLNGIDCIILKNRMNGS